MENKLRRSVNVLRVLDLADQNHWGFRLKDGGEMIQNPEYREGWWYLPVKGDEEIIPAKAKERIEALKRADIPIEGLVLGHEAPKLLSAPTKEIDFKPIQVPWETVSKAGEIAVKIVGTAIVMMAYVAGAILTMGFLLLDPALYVVLPDGTWVEVLSWYE